MKRPMWYVINLNTTKHAISAEFSDKDYPWGVGREKHPVSLVGIVQLPTRAEARRMCAELNRSRKPRA